MMAVNSNVCPRAFFTGVIIFEVSRKQKRVTKHLTESKLVALTDNIGFVELFQWLVSLLPNEKLDTPLIYQENT